MHGHVLELAGQGREVDRVRARLELLASDREQRVDRAVQPAGLGHDRLQRGGALRVRARPVRT